MNYYQSSNVVLSANHQETGRRFLSVMSAVFFFSSFSCSALQSISPSPDEKVQLVSCFSLRHPSVAVRQNLQRVWISDGGAAEWAEAHTVGGCCREEKKKKEEKTDEDCAGCALNAVFTSSSTFPVSRVNVESTRRLCCERKHTCRAACSQSRGSNGVSDRVFFPSPPPALRPCWLSAAAPCKPNRVINIIARNLCRY